MADDQSEDREPFEREDPPEEPEQQADAVQGVQPKTAEEIPDAGR